MLTQQKQVVVDGLLLQGEIYIYNIYIYVYG